MDNGELNRYKNLLLAKQQELATGKNLANSIPTAGELRGDPEAVRRIGTSVESLGFDYLLTCDHVLGATHEGREPKLTGPYTERDPFHDPLVMFAHLAALTRRSEFVTGILILLPKSVVVRSVVG